MLFFVYNIRGALIKYLKRKLKYYSVIFKNNMDSFQLLKRRPSTYNKLQQSTFRWMSSTFYERSNKLCSYRWRNWYETHTKQLRHQINSFMLYSKFISFLARKNLLVPLYCPWWVDKTMVFAFWRALDWQTINLSINFGRLFIPTL